MLSEGERDLTVSSGSRYNDKSTGEPHQSLRFML